MSYTRCGWPVHFFTETAVSNAEGETLFYSDGHKENNFHGASIIANNTNIKDKNQKSENS